MIAFENSGSDVQTKVDSLRTSFATEKLKHITHRRHEIAKLYRGLQDDMEGICNAIASEGRCSAAAADAEFRLTMDGIRKFYHALKTPDTRLQLRGAQRDGTRRLAVGVVAIRPASHSRLYSTLIPLTAAIAAGNCVLLELSEVDSSVNEVVAKILESAVTTETVQISGEKLQKSHLSQVDLFVDQHQIENRSLDCTPQLSNPSSSRAVAIVQWNSDLNDAAQSIATSRLSPYNTSPYSPTLVHVHQTAVAQFRRACLTYSEGFPSPYTNKSACMMAGLELDTLLKQAESQGVIKTFRNAKSGLSVVEVQPRLHKSSPILNSGIKGPYIVVLPFTKAADLAASSSTRSPLLAVYVFADDITCRSLAERIPATAAYCNQLPQPLLYGPASPPSHGHQMHPRYTPDMFSTSRPIVTERAPDIPTEIADLANKPTMMEKVGNELARCVSALIVIPAAVVSLVWGFWSVGSSYGWKGAGRLTFWMASSTRDMMGFGG